MRQIAKVFKENFLNSATRDPIDEQINRYLKIHQDQTIQSASYVYDHNGTLIREALVIFNKG